jgi:hypothetical protein
VSGRVGDARASRADTEDLATVSVLGRDGLGGSGGAGEPLEAEAGGLLLVAVVDEVAEAVVVLAVRVLVRLDGSGESRENESALHFDWCDDDFVILGYSYTT